MTERTIAELATLIERHVPGDGSHPSRIVGLNRTRASAPSAPVPRVYEPSFCVIAQGRKRSFLAGELYQYDPAHYLLGSVDLPVVSQIVSATPQEPYLCLRLHLDPKQIGALVMEADIAPTPPASGADLRGLLGKQSTTFRLSSNQRTESRSTQCRLDLKHFQRKIAKECVASQRLI